MNEEFKNILGNIDEDTANLQLPDPVLRDYYQDEQDRVFWFTHDVSTCAHELIRMIIRCNKEDKGIPTEDRVPIKIFIDSPGGDVLFMWTIINFIRISKTKIITINYCSAYSAAAEILAAGHERYALPGSHVMLHTGQCSFAGEATQVASTKKYFDALTKKTTEYLLSRTKIDPKKFKKKAVSDWYLSEEEALELGVVDKIVEDIDELF